MSEWNFKDDKVIFRLKCRQFLDHGCKQTKRNVFLAVLSVFMTNVFQDNLSYLQFWKSFSFEWSLTY